MHLDEARSVARDAVADAGVRIRLAAWQSKRIELKGAVDLVTDTDRLVEALIVERLRAAFPDHLIIAEEGAADGPVLRPRADEYVWYLDPIDGTTNFAHAFPHFSVSLALARGPQVLFGIVHDPMRLETFEARLGGGATLNGSRISVSDSTEMEKSLVATGFPYDRRERTDFYIGFLADCIRQARDVRRLGSAALDLCYVACGRFDAFWEWNLHPWDTVAGTIMVREAGGTVTDFRGAAFDPFGTQTLATNGGIHDAMVQILRRRLDDPPAP